MRKFFTTSFFDLFAIALACITATTVQAQTCPVEVTGSDALGPFYIEGPFTNRLAPESQLTDPSQRLEVTGTVYGDDCVPMANILVEPWYAGIPDENGDEYSKVGSELLYRAQIKTDECGKYQFTSTFPALYPQRPIRHIHYRISDQTVLLVTQMYFDGFITAGFDPPENQIGEVDTDTDGVRSVTFDIYVPVPGTGDADECDDGEEEQSGVQECFAGDTTVFVKDQGEVLMKDVQLGDQVMVDGQNKYERIYSFGHRHESVKTNYLQLHYTTAAAGSTSSTMSKDEQQQQKPRPLEISGDHMVFTADGRAIPASSVKVGDKLRGMIDSNSLGRSAGVIEIQAIKRVQRRGAFAPFTNSGTIVVNGGIVASTYVAFVSKNERHLSSPNSSFLIIGGTVTPFPFQWLAHTFQAPHRWYCTYVSDCLTESRNDDGISTWVARPLSFTKWLVGQQDAGNGFLILWLAFGPILCILTCFDLASNRLPVLSLIFLWVILQSKRRKGHSKTSSSCGLAYTKRT